jgi:hypothetical protein
MGSYKCKPNLHASIYSNDAQSEPAVKQSVNIFPLFNPQP